MVLDRTSLCVGPCSGQAFRREDSKLICLLPQGGVSSPQAAVDMWMAEAKDYKSASSSLPHGRRRRLTCHCSPSRSCTLPESNPKYSHFTQVRLLSTL